MSSSNTEKVERNAEIWRLYSIEGQSYAAIAAFFGLNVKRVWVVVNKWARKLRTDSEDHRQVAIEQSLDQYRRLRPLAQAGCRVAERLIDRNLATRSRLIGKKVTVETTQPPFSSKDLQAALSDDTVLD